MSREYKPLRLVTDNDSERISRLMDVCEEKFYAWQAKLDDIDTVWDDASEADSREELSASVDLMMIAHTAQGEAIKLWYEYIAVRRELLSIKIELSFD